MFSPPNQGNGKHDKVCECPADKTGVIEKLECLLGADAEISNKSDDECSRRDTNDGSNGRFEARMKAAEPCGEEVIPPCDHGQTDHRIEIETCAAKSIDDQQQGDGRSCDEGQRRALRSAQESLRWWRDEIEIRGPREYEN